MDNKRINTNNTVNAKTGVNTALSSRLKNLTATEKKKQKANHICAKCTNDIIVGEKYMSVTYNDGFTFKLYGAFHSECWKSFLNES